MGITYQEFKEDVQKRILQDHKGFATIIKDLDEFYNSEKDFVFFYPKNLYNNEETELIIVLQNGFLTLKKIEDGYKCEQYYGKVKSKVITVPKFMSNNHELIVEFDNGPELIFNSFKDSNSDWVDEYSKTIKELYKII